jgi:signal transduction histidine kinase
MLLLLHLFAVFLLVLLGFYVFVADPRRRAHQTFAAFIAFLAVWTINDLIFWNFPEFRDYAGIWAAASFANALVMQWALAVFAWVFPENARTPKRKTAVLFAPGIVLVPAALFGWLWHDIGFRGGEFFIELTPLAYAFVAYVVFVFCFGAFVLLKKYRKFHGTQEGQQVGAILWGLIITGILELITILILPFFGNYAFLPLSTLFVLPGVFIYAYAISNFRLFSLQTALDQFRLFPITFKVAVSIASVAVASFILFQIPIVWWAFRDGADADAWRRYLVFSLISALVPNLLLVLLVVRAVSRPLQRITVAAIEVANGSYGTEVDLRKSNDEIGILARSFNEMSRKMAADIELLKQLNEQLVRTEKLASMGVLAAGVAHEVNNPLASISSLIQIMQAKASIDPEISERLGLISEQIKRITQVTKGMTDFARSRPSEKRFADINRIIEASLRLAGYDRSFQGLVITTELSEKIPELLVNEDQMQQVFLNLLLNARDAMPDGGEISVISAIAETAARIEITDSGRGIDRSIRKNVFDPFFTTKPAGSGTGLGLSVCYGIITAHGGEIDVKDAQNGGTSFIITIPLDPAEQSIH